MKTKEEYEQALQIVSEVVSDWDPYALLSGEAPPNEFDDEIARIVAGLPRMHNEQDAASVVSRIFSSAFGANDFSQDSCSEVGRKLFLRLEECKLVDRAPSAREVETTFVELLSGRCTRDEADRWAGMWVNAPKAPQMHPAIWEALMALAGCNLTHGPGEGYLHSDKQISEWLEKLRRDLGLT